jgi:hypothetical protein
MSEETPGKAPKAAMNLDELEREGGPRQPFDFVLDGKRYLLADPQELDWQDVISAMSNPVMFFRLVLPPEDHVTFFRAKIAGWKMNALMGSYQTHYGLPSQGEAGALPR